MTESQPLPDRIEDADMAYHVHLVERVHWAQQAQQEIAKINGAFSSWAEFLHDKYGLGSSDAVDEHGGIARANTTNGQSET